MTCILIAKGELNMTRILIAKEGLNMKRILIAKEGLKWICCTIGNRLTT